MESVIIGTVAALVVLSVFLLGVACGSKVAGWKQSGPIAGEGYRGREASPAGGSEGFRISSAVQHRCCLWQQPRR